MNKSTSLNEATSTLDEEHNLLDRLAQIEKVLSLLANQRLVKDFYTTSEVAQLLNKSTFTVREWARLGRIRASKRPCGRGRSLEWMVSHTELVRLRSYGLLPRPEHVNSAAMQLSHDEKRVQHGAN